MHPRCWLPRRSWWLEHNQCHSLLILPSRCSREPTVEKQLEQLTLQMYREGIRYSEAVREFQRTFLATVLRDQNANQVKAAKKLDIHRNTLRRQIHELELDIKPLHVSRRRPSLSERVIVGQKRSRAQ